MKRLAPLLVLLGCGEPMPWERELTEPCETDDDCPGRTICHGTEHAEYRCSISCTLNEDCPEGDFCGVLVGDTQGVRVCFTPDAPTGAR